MSRGWIRNLNFRRPDVGSAFSLLGVHRLDELQVRTQSMEVAIANGQQNGQADLEKLCSVSGSRNAAQGEREAAAVPSTGDAHATDTRATEGPVDGRVSTPPSCFRFFVLRVLFAALVCCVCLCRFPFVGFR